ncbi:MAG: 50S ribosomal protein L6 [Anaerolineaceae bacterium]|nr:50S ribosomal protein L6 [Anaerolineaceae bacterium]NTV35327.1 50S ribosomal protein L6 [Anaerolineaceae bacterium]
MSRIGRLPVTIPAGVQVDIKGSEVTVKGPRGEMKRLFSPLMDIKKEDNQVNVTADYNMENAHALHGTTRALINNMVTGVSTGFTVVLEINGVGYRAEMDGPKLMMYVGYSHPVVFEPPAGISYEVELKTRQVKIIGADRELVGQIAADIRKIRPPEPYLGKGIKYLGEIIRRKAGKAGKGKGGKK